jgi:actinorhodin biosynthesis protein ActVIA
VPVPDSLTPELYVEVQAFYAHQMPLLERREVERFVATFTPDGSFSHAQYGWQMTGHDEMITATHANLSRYGTATIRHWFENRVISPVDDNIIQVTQTALVSVTGEDGTVTFEPSCTVHDVLVRQDGGLRTLSRVISHDSVDPTRIWAGELAGRAS